MKFSIITPNLNQGNFLPECLESVQKQAASFEHIVVDGGSSDNSHAVLSQFAGKVRVEDCQCRTPAEAVNHGMSVSDGDIIGWLGSDDFYEEGILTQVADHLSQHPEVDVIYGHTRLVDEGNEFIRLVKAPPPPNKRDDQRGLGIQPSVFFRRSVWEEYGSTDPSLLYWYDCAYWFRVLKAGGCFARLKVILGNRRLRLDALRYGSTCDAQAYNSATEMCEVQLRHSNKISNLAALRYGSRKLALEGIDRETSLDYDRGTIRLAIAQMMRGTQPRKFLKTRIVLSHMRTELEELVKRPRYLMRFLPRQLNRIVLSHLRHRVFTTNYSEPRPVSIPASYFQPIELGTSPPKVSIVTPNLNQDKYIEATIRSILDQNYPNLEYIIQDGVSTDRSLEVIASYESSLTHWDSSPDRGQADAINKGMQYTTGEIMAFLNSDDLLMPGSIAYVAKYFLEHPEIDVVYGHRILVDKNGEEISRWVLPPHDDTTIPYADYIPQETMFWRRRAWEAIGGCLDDTFQFALDWDLILRFREAGMKFQRLPRFLGAFRILDTQKTQTLIRTVGEREMRRLRQRYFGRAPSHREIRRRVKPYLRRQWLYDVCYKLGFAQY